MTLRTANKSALQATPGNCRLPVPTSLWGPYKLGDEMRMHRKHGQNIFELAAFLALFALIFFPAHLVANRVGVFPGFLLGFGICWAIALVWARLRRQEEETGNEAKAKASDQDGEPPNDSVRDTGAIHGECSR